MAVGASSDFAVSGLTGVNIATAHTSTITSPAPFRTGTTVPVTGNRVAVYAQMTVAFAQAASTATASVTCVTSTDGTVACEGGGISYICPAAINQALTTGDYVWCIKDGVFV